MQWSAELNSPIPVHFSSLIPKMSCSLLPSPVDHFQFTLIHGPNIPRSYVILFFTVSDFTFTTRHIHNWTLFPLWLSLFIPSGDISPLFSSSILVTYWPGEFNFQCHNLFVFSYCSWGSQIDNAEVVCHSLLHWTTFIYSRETKFVYIRKLV